MILQLRTWSEEGSDDTELEIEQKLEVYDKELQTSPTSTITWLTRSHAALGWSRNFTTVALLLANNESLNGTVVLSSTLTFLGYTAVFLHLHHLSQGYTTSRAPSESSNVWKALEKLSLTSLLLSSLLIVLMPPNGFANGIAFVVADLLIWSAVTSLVSEPTLHKTLFDLPPVCARLRRHCDTCGYPGTSHLFRMHDSKQATRFDLLLRCCNRYLAVH